MEEKRSVKEFFCSTAGRIVIILLSYLVMVGLMLLFGEVSSKINSTVSIVLAFVFFAVWIVCGWKSLSMIQPDIFLIMPLAGWAIYFVVKVLLAAIVGVFVSPYYIGKTISDILRRSMEGQ